jgi:hypothetical protein
MYGYALIRQLDLVLVATTRYWCQAEGSLVRCEITARLFSQEGRFPGEILKARELGSADIFLVGYDPGATAKGNGAPRLPYAVGPSASMSVRIHNRRRRKLGLGGRRAYGGKFMRRWRS